MIVFLIVKLVPLIAMFLQAQNSVRFDKFQSLGDGWTDQAIGFLTFHPSI
jgi:hypothetical protein